MTSTVLITGTSSGFGKATALRFAAEGWNVVATMRTPQTDPELDLLENVLVTRLDVQDVDSIESAIAAGIDRFGRIDALVNNAGFGQHGVFETVPRELVMQQFEVNVFGVMDVTRAMLPHFRANRSGVIINVSSGAGIFGLPRISLYCASKFALEGFSEALSYELLSQNIVLKIVEPGGVTSTKFGARSEAEFGKTERVADYDDFNTHTDEIFSGLRNEVVQTEHDVANVIFEATTDGTQQLRYVATTDILPLVNARRSTSEEEYMQLLRSRFLGVAAE